MTTTGWELEVSSGARLALDGLRTYGLTGHQHYHAYHCSCPDCQPHPHYGPDQKWFKAQNDCTADGEIISGIFQYGSDEMDEAIHGLGAVLLRSGATTDGNVGNHVHVGANELTPANTPRLARLFVKYADSLREIASGPRSGMRTYNGEFQNIPATDALWTATRSDENRYDSPQYRTGSLLAWRGSTVEFRLWNAVRAPWRIRTHVGLSVAMVQAAVAGVDTTFDSTLTLEETIGDFIDSDTWAGILRQRYSKGGISE